MTTRCPHCGWPDDQPFQIVSRHRTATGETVWTRCSCGSLQMRVLDPAGTRVTARSRPAAPAPRVAPTTVPDPGTGDDVDAAPCRPR